MQASKRIRLAITGLAAFAGLAVALAAGSTSAQSPADRVPVNVMIVQTSNTKGEVDPRALELHEKLRNQLRYRSMRVIQEQRVDLEMNQVGTVDLPDGRKVRMRPLPATRIGWTKADRLRFRPIGETLAVLEARGFRTRVVPASWWVLPGNVLACARAPQGAVE